MLFLQSVKSVQLNKASPGEEDVSRRLNPMLSAGVQSLWPLPQSASAAGGAVRAARSCFVRDVTRSLLQLAACIHVDSELMKAFPKAGSRFDALFWSWFACSGFAFSSLFAAVTLIALWSGFSWTESQVPHCIAPVVRPYLFNLILAVWCLSRKWGENPKQAQLKKLKGGISNRENPRRAGRHEMKLQTAH